MKWEYQILDSSEIIDEQGLQKIGEDGWELCAVRQSQFFFKRVIQESMPKLSFSFPTAAAVTNANLLTGFDSDK